MDKIDSNDLATNEKLFLLECMKMAADEGFHLNGHYGSKLSKAESYDLAVRLCRETGLSIDGRDWIRDLER